MSYRLVCFLIVGSLLAGCFARPDAGSNADDPWHDGVLDLRERHLLNWTVDPVDKWSTTLVQGVHAILPAQEADVPFTLPTGKGPATATINMGIFRPDVPEGTKVPIVADIGPYYYDLDIAATEPANRLGRFLINNLVPHGFAVAQISVPGTGKSGGCMDLMGPVEQAGIQAAVKWLAEQPWSNGNVGLIGRSYDGSTVWEAVMTPNTPVKTVVPISGLYGQYDLMWKNGSAELRGPGILWSLYYMFTLTPAEHQSTGVPRRIGNQPVAVPIYGYHPDEFVPTPEYAPEHAKRLAENSICPETQVGAAQALATYALGSPPAPQANAYWSDRSFREEVLANYKGSVYFIHGLQDWNVDPHMAFPFYQELEAKGLEMRGLFGQWAHNYPDRLGEHEFCDNIKRRTGEPVSRCHPPQSVRLDWAQDLLEWFTYYLKGEGPKPALHVEVQDNEAGKAGGRWRVEATYPPRDVTWSSYKLSDLSGNGGVLTEANQLVFTSPKLERDVRIAGLAQFHVKVTPTGEGGSIFAELTTNGRHVAHAVMDLRYAAGGHEPRPVVPGVPIVAKMEFFAADDVLKAGETFVLTLTTTGEDYLPSSGTAPVLIEKMAESVLRLPTIERSEESFFQPPDASKVDYEATGSQP